MKTKRSFATRALFGLALLSFGCSVGSKPPDAPGTQASDSLDALTNEELAVRLHRLSREPRLRDELVLYVTSLLGGRSPSDDQVDELMRDLGPHLARDYLAFYDRSTLLAAVRFFGSDAGRPYALRHPAVERLLLQKEQLLLRRFVARAHDSSSPDAPSVETSSALPPDSAAPIPEEPASEQPSNDDSPAANGAPGEVARAKKTCKEPALKPLPPVDPEPLLRRLTGRWYACSGKFDVVGQEGQQTAAGLEVTSEGRWYLLDATATGALVRRSPRDMRDQFSGRVGPDGGNLLFTFDSSTNGGGFMANLVFSSTAPAMDFDQTRMVRVIPP